MDTANILKKGIVNETIYISPLEIVNSGLWYSGDCEPPDECNCEEVFHTCSHSPSEDFHAILQNIKEDFNKEEYTRLFQEIKNKGFIYPLGALMRSNYQGIGLIDGHHRLFISLSLQLNKIPIHVFAPNTQLIDITRWDSNMWSGV